MIAARNGALVSGTATTVIAVFFGISIILTVFVVNTAGEEIQDAANIPEDFEPLSDRTLSQSVDIQVNENRIAGSVAQVLYGVQVPRGNGEQVELMEALRLYTYCDGKRAIRMCSAYPSKSDIRSEVTSTLDTVFGVASPSDRPYRFIVSYQGRPLISVGSTAGTSTVEFVEPLPGAQHVRMSFQVDAGEFSTGVTTK